jgi:hypothetical protein
MLPAPILPTQFPADFDLDEGRCLLCDGPLDTGWVCADCGADHFNGAKLIFETPEGGA